MRDLLLWIAIAVGAVLAALALIWLLPAITTVAALLVTCLLLWAGWRALTGFVWFGISAGPRRRRRR